MTARLRPVLIGALLGVATVVAAAYGLLVTAAELVARQEDHQ